jgi:hypothetical protein
LQPVQVDDQGTTLGQMGRGAVAITVTIDAGIPVRLITTHLKSKLLTFPGGRFNPHPWDRRDGDPLGCAGRRIPRRHRRCRHR